MVSKAIQSLVEQLDLRADFNTVCSPLDGEHFKPFCLVQKKKQHPFQKSDYDKTDFKLHDVLLLGDHTAKLDVQESYEWTIKDQVDENVDAEISGQVAVPNLDVNLDSSVNMSRSQSMKVKRIYIPYRGLDSIIKEGKLNMRHSFIKQSKKLQCDLYVITEVIEMVEPTELVESNQTKGRVVSTALFKTYVKGAINRKKTIVLPKGCTLAFRVKRLVISGESLEIYSDNNRPPSIGGSFRKTAIMKTDDQERCVSDALKRWNLAIDRISENKCKWNSVQKVPKNNLEDLQREVKRKSAELSLSEDLCGKFLNGFVAIMRGNDLLKELEFQLKQALDGTQQLKPRADRPELQDLVENLQDSSAAIIPRLADSVLYFLQALNELTESQLILLADSVEKNIVSKQLALVESIINNASSTEEWKFTVDTQNFTEDDLNITGAMIDIRGVTLQKNEHSLAGTGNPDAYSALSALYVALHVLNLLSI